MLNYNWTGAKVFPILHKDITEINYSVFSCPAKLRPRRNFLSSDHLSFRLSFKRVKLRVYFSSKFSLLCKKIAIC